MTRKAQAGAKKPRKPTTKGQTLNINEEHFCRAYIETGSLTEAYLRGIAKDKSMNRITAGVLGHQRLKNPKIQKRISELYQPTLDRYEVTADKVVRELAKLAFSNIQDYMSIGPDGLPALDLSTLDRDQAAAISEVTCEIIRTEGDGEGSRLPVLKAKIKLADKRASLVELGKMLGVLTSTVNVKGHVDHSHTHDHLHRDVSESDRFLTGGDRSGRSEGASKASLPH
jgi:phage terminase small subunit